MNTIWDNMDDIIVISLREATERQAQVTEELQRVGVTKYRFLIVDRPVNKNGIYGCYTSHQRALQESKQSGYKRVCILEDDVEFGTLEELQVAHDAYGTFIQSDTVWDFMMLGWIPFSASKTKFPNILKIKCAGAAHAYVANESMINLGLPDASPDITMFCTSCKTNESSAFDSTCRTQYEVYVIRPSIAHQSFTTSFIENAAVTSLRFIAVQIFSPRYLEKNIEYLSSPTIYILILTSVCIFMALVITLPFILLIKKH